VIGPDKAWTVLQAGLQFCSGFERHDRDLGELHVASQIVRVKNGLDVPQAVTGISALAG
jgi:hypothetical protein